MPHAVEPPQAANDSNDDDLIQSLLAGNADGLQALEGFESRELDQDDKAEGAKDYEDISDDEEDLPDEEEDGAQESRANGDGHLNGDEAAARPDGDVFEEDPFDDLFNAGDQSSPPPPAAGDKASREAQDGRASFASSPDADSVFSPTKGQVESPSVIQDDDDDDEDMFDEEDDDVRLQRKLFEEARMKQDRLALGDLGEEPPPPPSTDAELFSLIWPGFEPDKPPRFGDLLPGKRAYYVPKAPLKPPRPVNPTKLSLELAQDQEKNFRLPATAPASFPSRQAEAQSNGLVLIEERDDTQQVSDDDFDIDTPNDMEPIGGLTWQDLALLCEDWTIPDGEMSADEDSLLPNGDSSMQDLFGDDDMQIDHDRPSKKRKLDSSTNGALRVLHDFNTSIDDPEAATARLAKKVYLDLNDPQMLIDIQQPGTNAAARRNAGGHFKRDAVGGLTKDMHRRYNISNDEAYEMLKENHQNKIRSILGNLTVEHSLPAVKLQYPFYKVRLSSKEARSFHRPQLHFTPNQAIDFEKSRFIKKKHLRGKEIASIFEKTKDLSMADNSSMLLLEYSEEYPIMLSNFGMGTRLINYYRRKDAQDNSRPKLDIGETAVLLPQDKSPFSIFGNVDPGETTPTISTGIYRAPVFRHEADEQDFLVIRNSTGVDGPSWYLKNIENLHIVGQEFPSVEVPGTHSRKVTDAAKKRLKMLSWRIYKKNSELGKAAALKNDMILKHLPGSDIPQNRSKMREFMNYDKERGWVPRDGEYPPSEEQIRSMIKPEDVCLLESMQVGDRHLQDAGYNKDEAEVDQDDDDDKDESLDQQLAPWQTSKNFLNACQGKAMLQLHGEGDPSGRGLAFNFIRTSMKGGFRDLGEGVEDRLDAKKLKENGGHSYNVARQQKAYNDAIRRIWQAQKSSLSSIMDNSDTEMDDDQDGRATPATANRTPNSGLARSRRDDETGSVLSRYSATSDTGKVLKITRWIRDKYGKPLQQQEIVRDPRVIREYIKRRKTHDMEALSLADLKPTGDADADEQRKQMILNELSRLERNKERRFAREKAKGIFSAASPDSGEAGSPSADPSQPRRTTIGGTQRKCANCGQVGHIKTNKKLCPMLNGTIKPDDSLGDSAFGGGGGNATGGAGSPAFAM